MANKQWSFTYIMLKILTNGLARLPNISNLAMYQFIKNDVCRILCFRDERFFLITPEQEEI